MLTILALFQVRLQISDATGYPVAGASVCCDSVLLSLSAMDGTFELPFETDSIEVSAVGYAPWNGPVPPEGILILETVPVPSGMVISVTASRGGLRDLYPSTTVLGPEDIEHIYTCGLRALSSRSSGIFVRQYGGAMPVVSISIRGTSAAHSGYYVDGHPVGSSMNGLPGMTLDPAVFGALEVARGGGSGLLRSGMAGALNFLPESQNRAPRIELSADDRGGCRVSGAVSTGSGRLAVSLTRMVGLMDSEALSATALLTGREGALRFGLLASGSGGETESPEWTAPTDATRHLYSLDGWLRYRTGRLGLSGDFGARRMLYSSTSPSIIDDDHSEVNSAVTLEYDPDVPLLDLRLAISADHDILRSTSIGERDRTGGDISASIGHSGIAAVNGSARLSLSDDGEPMTGLLLNAGLPLADSFISFHLSGSKGFRRPTFNDLYWPEDEFAIGNPVLLPETSLEAEAGAVLAGIGPIRLSITAFLAVTDDLIRWEPGEVGKWSPVNVARALRKGIESEVWFTLGSFGLSGTFTLLKVTDNDPSSTNYQRVLPYTPDYTFGILADADIWKGLTPWLSVDGMGLRFKNYSETSWLPAYSLVSAGIRIPLPVYSGFTLGISGTNLLDEEYEETNGYPGEPRTLRAMVQWNGER